MPIAATFNSLGVATLILIFFGFGKKANVILALSMLLEVIEDFLDQFYIISLVQ
jgi:hypothetical protein